MKLFVPPVSAFEENREEGAPLKLANGTLKLSALLYAARAGSVLEAVRKWVEVFGLPKPELPRSLEEELRLCARAYLETMWVPGRGWPHAVPGWEPEPYPGYAHVLLLTSYVVRDADLKAAILARVREALSLAEARWGPGALISGVGCHIPTPQLPFLVGRLEQGLLQWRDEVARLTAAQGPDGEWGFQPSAAPCGAEVARKLGEPGAREVGITATHAAEVLRYARVTGDPVALRAGLRALKAMERYRVPRGAQVWEVPLRAPDVLAAAKALEAYLEAYIATGEERYLEGARYWALAGLPFVYLWALPDRPVMAGAAIPVYASSCLQGPGWFGIPVQWNGLVYAYHLLRLSAYDRSFPWRELATLILASAMRQQVTREARGKPVGSYPDSWNLVADRDQPPYINPEALAKVALALAGASPDLNTARVGGVTVSTPAEILEAELSDNELRLRLRWQREGPVHVLISAPALEVWRGLERLPRVADINTAVEGWKVSPLLNATIVKVAPGEVELRLALRGRPARSGGNSFWARSEGVRVKYVRLGERCGLKVSAISLGTWHLPRLPERDEAGAYKIDYEEFKRILKRAYDEGLNFIDTANRYHGGIAPVPLTHVGYAERLLGAAIKELGLDREELVIATKVAGRMSPGPNGEGLSRKHIMWQIRESLRRLQTDYIDVYYAHAFDPETPKLETLTTFNDLVRQGLVRYIGMSNVPAWHLAEYAVLAEERGLEPIVVLQYRYNLLDRSVEADIIPLAKRFGMGLAAYSPLAEGVLTGKYVDFEAGKWRVPPGSRGEYRDMSRYFTDRNLKILSKLRELASERGVTMAQLALAWLINVGEKVWGIPIVPIVGATKLQHLEEALGALSLNLSHDDLKALDEATRAP